LDCEEDLADKYRRAFSKNDRQVIKELKKTTPKSKHHVLKKLECLRKYGFCKAHAYSYAQLVWQLAYCKAHNPIKFWKAALKNCKSFYRRWVHLYEASCAGVDVMALLAKEQKSIYAEARSHKRFDISPLEQLRNYGYWNMKQHQFVEGCFLRPCDEADIEKYRRETDSKPANSTSKPANSASKPNLVAFKGIIACSRLLALEPGRDSTVVMSMCVGNRVYPEVTVTGQTPNINMMVGCEGIGEMTDRDILAIQSTEFKFF
jgi:hypothetical protein